MPRLGNFVTLSPAPNFAGWLSRQRTQPSPALAEADRTALAALDRPDWWSDEDTLEEIREPRLRAPATYFMTARNSSGSPLDAVARFHLGNGARLERLNWPADL